MAEHNPRASGFSWKKLDTKLNRIAAVITLITAGAAVFSWSDQPVTTSNDISGSVTQVVSDNGVAVINQGDHSTIQIGLTEAELRKELEALKATLSALLLHAKDAARVPQLQAQLEETERQLADLGQALEGRKKQLQEANHALEKLKGELPETVLEKARAALRKGDTQAAEQAFDSVVENQGASVALAAYESARLAESRIDYSKAIQNYRIAVSLRPSNPNYLNRAAVLATELALYPEARRWLEAARGLFEELGIESEAYADVLNSSANLYRVQNEYLEAGRLYEKSLGLHERSIIDAPLLMAATLSNLAGL